MFIPLPFTEWLELVQREFEQVGLTLPDDIEIMELAHLECLEEEKSIEQFVAEAAAEQGKL